MRLFIAIELPGEVKAALAALQTALRQTRAQAAWPKPENLHLTLKFLGEVEPARLPAIEQACVATASQAKRFPLTLQGCGFFPKAQRPRVVWAGLADETQALPPLQGALEAQLAALGFARADKPFHPHLTLGRIKTPQNIRPLAACAAAYHLPPLPFIVTELVLMQSTLTPAGSLYTPLARAPLG